MQLPDLFVVLGAHLVFSIWAQEHFQDEKFIGFANQLFLQKHKEKKKHLERSNTMVECTVFI